jgi:hypothetical protein
MKNKASMPRTALRYAIEKMPRDRQRAEYDVISDTPYPQLPLFTLH